MVNSAALQHPQVRFVYMGIRSVTGSNIVLTEKTRKIVVNIFCLSILLFSAQEGVVATPQGMLQFNLFLFEKNLKEENGFM